MILLDIHAIIYPTIKCDIHIILIPSNRIKYENTQTYF